MRKETRNQKPETRNIKERKFRILNCLFTLYTLHFTLVTGGFCDMLRLKEIPEGNEGKQIQIPNYQNFYPAGCRWQSHAFYILSLGFRVLILEFLMVLFFAQDGSCDMLRLKETPEGNEGNEVEILEEREDSFIIKVPKEEIAIIKRKRPTELNLWKEKRILWEDAGDYLTLYLPKEKIVLPENYTGQEYDSAGVLKKELGTAGAEGRPETSAFWKGRGKITGRVLKGGMPLARARLKIVNVSPRDALSRILGPDENRPEDFVRAALTNELGQYEFDSVPLGEYDIYWSAPGSQSWFRRLSEEPDITVRPGETVKCPDIELK